MTEVELTPDMAPPKTAGAARGTINGTVLNGLVNYTIRAIPLPRKVTDFLLSNITTMSKMLSQRGDSTDEADEQDELEAGEGVQGSQRVLSAQQFWEELEGLFKRAGPEWAGAADRIWSFGPKRLGANVLLDPAGKIKLRFVLTYRLGPITDPRLRGKENIIAEAREKGASADEALARTQDAANEDQLAALSSDATTAKAELRLLKDFENSIEAGFQMATFQGPLCSEPVVGMAWVVESIEYKPDEEESEQGESGLFAQGLGG